MKKISQKYQIFWLLMENYKNKQNIFISAGAFCEKNVNMKIFGWQWLSYKGATRISDTVYDELPDTVIERKSFRARSGAIYFKYRLIDKFNPNDLPKDYHKFVTEFKR